MRPFKDIKEFNTKTHKSIGPIIRIRYKENHDDIVTGIITGYDEKTFVLHVGGYRCCLWDMCEVHDYFDERSNKWLPFGVEEPEEQIEPHKFKVGKKYYDYGYEKFEVLINTKYKDPADNKVKVILNGTTISEVYTDENGNERATILDDIVKAEDEIKEWNR